MIEGFMIDPSHGVNLQAAWVEGQPKKNVIGAVKMMDKKLVSIVSYRCPQCGCLMNFAPHGSSV
jgi:lipopolysaccharide biosynthesis regulator YciM